MWVLERCIGHLGRWGDGGRREESMCASEYARDQYKHNIYHITLYRVLFILASKSHFCVLGFKLKLAPQIFAFVNDRGNHTEMI